MNCQNPRFVAGAILLLFCTPLLIAMLMRSSWWDYQPPGRANRGQLLRPPVPIPLGGLERQYAPAGSPGPGEARQWVLLYPFPGTCGTACRADITGLRQVHLASGRHRGRVSLWLLAPERIDRQTQKRLVGLYPEFNVLVDVDGQARRVLAILGDEDAGRATPWEARKAFLLDPAANIILSYPAVFDPNDINQDLERLLRWSAQE